MIASWFQNIITFNVMVAFIVGIFVGQVGNWLNYRWRKHKHPETVVKRNYWEAVVGIVTVVVLLWIMIATQQARNCALTLHSSLQVEINAARIEREAFQKAIVKQSRLPKEIDNLPNNDPRKRAAMKPIEDEYFGQIAIATKIREDNAGVKEAAQHACGGRR